MLAKTPNLVRHKLAITAHPITPDPPPPPLPAPADLPFLLATTGQIATDRTRPGYARPLSPQPDLLRAGAHRLGVRRPAGAESGALCHPACRALLQGTAELAHPPWNGHCPLW